MSLPGKVIDGGIAGVTGVVASFPLDSVKTRVQASKKPLNFYNTGATILKNEGIRVLYKGIESNLAGIILEKAIKLCVNDMIRNHYNVDNLTGMKAIWYGALAGSTAGFCQSVITTPMELSKIKGQMKAKTGESYNFISDLSKKVKTEGIKSIYRGWTATLARDIPWSFIYFPMYALLRDLGLKELGFPGNFAAGWLSGGIASVVCTPMDVIKTRLQKPRGQNKTKINLGYLECTKEIYKNEGMATFFKGSGPRFICVGILMGVAQVFYELKIGDRLLSNKNKDQQHKKNDWGK